MRAASAVCSRPLFCPWNSGSRMNTEISAAHPDMTSSVVRTGRALGLADPLGVVLQRTQQRDAQARLVRAAVRASGSCCNRNGRTRPRPASQATAHSTEPCLPDFSTLPLNG